jgi:hypothetical protein
MQQEAERLRKSGRATHWIDLAAYRSLPATEIEKAASEDGSTLFIDGLDVALLSQHTLLDEIGRLISDMRRDPASSFSIRIAIRTGVRCDALTDHLVQTFGDATSELALAPLSAADLRKAARAEDVDPEDFLSYVVAVRAGPLATQPPTLRMLFALWHKGEKPPVRREMLYEAGVQELVREVETARVSRAGGDQEQFIGQLDVDGRLAVAGRIAALMVFSDRTVLDLSNEADSKVALHAEAVSRGSEPTDFARVEVRRVGVREVARTGLFRSDGGDRYAFAHPSFMDFLAARFVSKRGMNAAQVLSLVKASGANGVERVAGNRVDVASWLAANNSKFFDFLSTYDPQVVLRSGIPRRSAGERMKLAEGLLLVSASESLDLEELEASGDLVLVSNPQLYGRLIALIKDKSLPLTQRRFATSLIEYCGDDISPAELLAVVTDPDDDHELRRDALSALKFTKIEEQCDAIIALARSGTDKDERHKLRALALRLVYPRLAGGGDVIRILIPFYDGTSDSSYHHFCMHLLRNLRDAELPGALAAVADIARRRYCKFARNNDPLRGDFRVQ